APRPAPPDPAIRAAAEATLRARIAEAPAQPQPWQHLALLLAETARPAEAADAFAEAVRLGASAAALALPHALALESAGRRKDAIAVARAALDRRPKDFPLTNLLGVLLKRAGRLAEAAAAFEAAKRLEPRNTSPWNNLGNTLHLAGDYAGAASAYAGAARIEPRNAEFWRLQGRSLAAAGDAEGARRCLDRALLIDPRNLEAGLQLCGLLLQAGAFDTARGVLVRLAQARPGEAAIGVMQARIAWRAGEIEAAKAGFAAVLGATPGHPQAAILLSRLHGDGDRAAANQLLRDALAQRPEDPELSAELIDSLSRSRYGSETAHIEDAYALAVAHMDRHRDRVAEDARPLRTIFQRCLDEARLAATGALPDLARRWLAEGRVAPLHYELGQVATLEDRIRILEWHRAWGDGVARGIRPVAPLPAPALATGRKIRIGFMSSDLRNHPVTYFALPLFTEHDRDRFEVFCYSFYEGARDAVQARIEQSVHAFRWWPRRPDQLVAEGIAADGIDMLFELGGSTAMNKIEVMARRPARIGASWLGYPHSAGLSGIDHILVDPHLAPTDPRLLIETPFEMPESWVALGPLGFGPEPILPGLPEDRAGRITFGTMNNPYKYTTACLDAWAAVLREVPGSRFLFVRPEGSTAPFQANARAAFAARDVDPDRIAFVGVRGRHLPHYNEIDIALDSLPHVGGTTTCETLWMGVPVVTLAGPGFPERLSHSNLVNAGLPDLSTGSVADYVARAADLARDRALRLRLRHSLRDLIRARPLGQPGRFTKHFYAKVEEVVRA
ncbi:tetratricopeptide repeat protein, partial [Neoroseomonas rubea]|uniref:tetratricopeptide repeat protein n=1 Tax=Neoroseomonas rubea TaxID=2748666 RepID=UPI0018DFB998